MENIVGKKRSNPLGKYNRLVPSTDAEKFWHISLEYEGNKTVWTCNYGWLLISQEKEEAEGCISYQFSLWKPESLEVINLPPLNLKPNQIIGAGTLLSPPDNPGSLVILFEEYLRDIIYYRFGDKHWNKRWLGKEIADIGHGGIEDTICQNFITHCEGKLYAATLDKGYLMVISRNLKLRPLNCRLPTTFSPQESSSMYLLDFCGQLCFLKVSWGGVNEGDVIDIDFFKLELSRNRKRWVRVKSAKDRAFFISTNYAFSCPVNEPEIEGGHIYLFQNNRFYSINIEDKSFSASLLFKNLSELKDSPLLATRDLIRLCNPQAKPEHPISKLEVEKEGMLIEGNNETSSNNFCDLPSDILGFIAKKLSPVDYNNFRSVCHNFRRLVPHVKWSEASFKLQLLSLSPWLAFSRGNSCDTHNFIDPHSRSEYLIKIPDGKEIPNGKVRHLAADM